MDTTSLRSENIIQPQYSDHQSLSESVVQGTTIFLIVKETGEIEFKSQSYCDVFDPEDEIKSVNEIETDPDLSLIVSGMKYNKTKKLSLEILFYFLKNKEVKDFSVNINKIKILDHNFYLLLFEENKVFQVFENKINTLQHALEQGHIPVLIMDENFKAKYVTQNFEQILERDIENLYRQSITDILGNYISSEDEADLLISLRTQSKWSRIIKVKQDLAQPNFYDLHLTSVFDANLNQWSYILSAYNITDHVLKNKALQKEEERLRTIINNISDALFVIKKTKGGLKFEIGNENFYDLFTLDRHYFNENNLLEELGETLWLEIKKSLLMIEKENCENNSTKFYDTQLDKYFQMDITFVVHPLEEQRMYIITLRDTTEKEKYQKQLQSAFKKEKELNNLKTLILHNMSHELRTPANAMMGYTDIIEDSIEEKDYETVSEISHAIKDILYKLIGLFSNIIELSSLESGSFNLEEVHINCNQILRSVYNKQLQDAEKKELEFILDLYEESLFVETDWIKFEKMIAELTKNAIKFTNSGRVKISSTKTSANEAEIKISDTGTGIEESKIQLVLQPFQQEEEFYTRSYEGSGLGLTIANRIASILGGKFQIKSQKNVGTNITITFPLVANRKEELDK